ncbi:MAG: hypothetical protein ACTSVU_03760 [Promethearchaeota archaeon]
MTEQPKKKKGPKTLLGVFEIIPDYDEIPDEMSLKDVMEQKIKSIVEQTEGYIETFRIEEVAFGAQKIIARIILKEREGGTQPLEDAISSVPEILRAECSMVSIIS